MHKSLDALCQLHALPVTQECIEHLKTTFAHLPKLFVKAFPILCLGRGVELKVNKTTPTPNLIQYLC